MIEPLALRNLLAYSTQIALVTAAGALAAWMLRIDVATVRYTYWRSLLALCLLLPLIQPWVPPTMRPIARPAIADSTASPAASSNAAITAPARAVGSSPSITEWPAVLTGLIVAGVAARLTWLAIGLWRLRRLRRCGSRATDPELDELRGVLRVNPEVRWVPNRGQPATFGFLRPVVLLPNFLQSLDPALRRAVVAHELWHVRRRDWIFVVSEEVVCAALWFHPAIWWLVARIRNAREEAVDELTILVTGARRPYLAALLAFADEPPLFAAATFARRRHLFQRMVLISKEAVMSSQRVVASCTAVAALVLCSSWFAVQAIPLEGRHPVLRVAGQPPPPPPAPPRDRRESPSQVVESEQQLLKAIAANPRDVPAHLKLARRQRERGAMQEAESTLLRLRQNVPNDKTVLDALAQHYAKAGEFDRAIATLEEVVQLDPSDPARHHMLSVFFWEKAFRDQTLSPNVRREYIEAGIAAADRAISLNGDYMEALVYKNILLRMQAEMAPDAATKQRLIAEADALRARAMELKRSHPGNAPGLLRGDMPPPPPPPPPAPAAEYGAAPIRVGGNVQPPKKLVNVSPEYPADARDSGVQGVVVLEVVIDASGHVAETRVLRSVPLLDKAAIDAVRQWVFEPTLLNGAPVPVIMTTTVNFTLP